MFTIELGTKVKSNINGFEGLAVSRSEHLNGCNRYWVTPPVSKEGKIVDGSWFDEQELIIVSKPKLKPTNQPKQESYRPGGFPSQIK